MTGPAADLDRKNLRASDQDREHAAEVLRDAAGEGRLNRSAPTPGRLTAPHRLWASLGPGVPLQMSHAQLEELIPPDAWREGAPPMTCPSFSSTPATGSAITRRCPRRRRRASSWTESRPGPGGLIGADAQLIDTFVRTNPDAAYDYDYDELGKMAADAAAATAR